VPLAVLESESQLIRHTLFGSEAVYRVLERAGGIVTTEVVSAPGLAAGMRVRLLADAVERMERADSRHSPFVRSHGFLSPAAA